MDFGTLLQTAKENEHNKKEIRYYSTKFSPPKKEEKKAKALSANIQKFLARKEAEEKQKTLEANRKREELLALRSKDKKAQRRVNVMLKRTKSANQSVIEDAVDKDNTAVTLAGPSQPDEDDYGYVSQEASAFYNKMMEKYNKMPDEPKFPSSKKKASFNLSNTKDRVKAALEREKEEALLPHKRKRKHHDQEGEPSKEEVSEQDERMEPSPAKVKPKVNAPPTLNFTDLLKLAEQKQHQPIMIEVKPKEEEGPLMTKKQKREFERIQQWKENKKNRESGRPIPDKTENRIPKVSSSQVNGHKIKPSGDNTQLPSKPNIPNKSANLDRLSNNLPKSSASSSHNSQNMKPRDREVAQKNPSQIQRSSLKPEVSPNKSKLPNSLPKKKPESSAVPSKKPQPTKELDRKSITSKPSLGSSNSQSNLKPITKSNGNITNYKKDVTMSNSSKELQKPKERQMPPKNIQPTKKAPSSDLKPKQFPLKDLKPKQFPPADLRPKQFPPADLKPKQFPPPDVRQKEFPPKDVRRKPPMANKRRILDDDEEYDSEMDDFIDDGPEETEDYSRYIKDIFGYDKSKYRVVDEDDVDNMESSFAQQMREDIRSTKLGIMEDLEDMQREKEEKRMKSLMKKRRKL